MKRGCFPKPGSSAGAVAKILAFFRVGSVEAWKQGYALANVSYRHSPSLRSDEVALATWRRLSTIEAAKQGCAAYDRKGFMRAVREIRGLTR